MKTLLHLFFIIILSISIHVSAHSQCLHDQRSLLFQFKQTLSLDFSGELSGKLNTWNSSTDCCSWGGVTCNFNGHVVGLNLKSERISSGINDSSPLFSLRFLSVIDLSFNNLSSPIPQFLANFSNLSSLALQGSGLHGTVPEKIFQVPTLKTLDLSYNDQLHGSLPDFYHNASLQELYLSNCKFSGMIPSSISNLRERVYLDLSSNNFSGPIPSFSYLRELVYLDLSFNNFSGPIPSFSYLRELVYLDLSFNNFSGPIPSFSYLRELVHLDLSFNIFSGPIPSFSFVKKLTRLDLNGNKLNGSISFTNWKELPNLESLDLSNCKFSGMIPSSISNLRELYNLNLSFNNFSGPIPSFSFLKKLMQLYLNGNKLNGSISSTKWKRFSNLHILDLGSNSFTGEISWSNLFGISSLYEVDLSHNQFTGRMNELPKLSSMPRRLDLSCNRIHGVLPSWFWEIDNLQWFNISHNFLTEIGKPSHGLTSRLLIVDLHSNHIQGQIQFPPPFVQYVDYSSNNFSSVLSTSLFRYLNSTRFLFLSNNNLQGSIPYTICSISLEALDLSNNSLSGKIPECLFQNGPNLTVLKLSSNKLTGPIPNKFARNCKLDYLDLSGNLLEGKIPRSMENCKVLQFLNLGKNQLSDIFPQHLMKISTLQVLGLQSNKLHGSVDCPKNKGSWRNLHVINVASNNFGGELPENCLQTWVGMMVHKNEDEALGVFSWNFYVEDGSERAMYSTIGGSYFYDTFVTIKGQEMELPKIFLDYTFIDFSCNDFRGQIPKVIGELKELRFLNLSHNSLDGRIPPSLGRMKNLEALDLSRNNLSGLIPSELASLTFLEYGVFSYNKLVGQIPTSTQLQSFPSSYFEGNPGLCGPPLKTKCSKDNPLTKEPDDDASYPKSAIEWSFISIEVGFTFGLGVLILPLTFSRRWRIQYYRHVEQVLFKLLPRLDPRNYKSRERKVGNRQNVRRH